MGLLLTLLHQAGLSVNEHSDHSAVLFDVGQILVNVLATDRILPFLSVLSECLLLRSVPKVSQTIDGDEELVSKAVSS